MKASSSQCPVPRSRPSSRSQMATQAAAQSAPTRPVDVFPPMKHRAGVFGQQPQQCLASALTSETLCRTADPRLIPAATAPATVTTAISSPAIDVSGDSRYSNLIHAKSSFLKCEGGQRPSLLKNSAGRRCAKGTIQSCRTQQNDARFSPAANLPGCTTRFNSAPASLVVLQRGPPRESTPGRPITQRSAPGALHILGRAYSFARRCISVRSSVI